MKQIKKALALLLSAVLLMGLLPAAALAAEDDPLTRLDLNMAIYNKPQFGLSGQTSSEEMPFTDLDGLTAEQINAFGVLKDIGLLLEDDPDGSIHPGAPALRFEAIICLWFMTGGMSDGEVATVLPKDVEEDAEYYVPVKSFYDRGILTEEDMDEDGNFRPEDALTAAQLEAWFTAFDKWLEDYVSSQPVTRVMLVTAIYNSPIFGLSEKTSSDKEPFTDLEGLTDDQINAFAVLKEAKLLSGNADGTVTPFGLVNRGSAAVLLWRAASAAGIESVEPVTPPYKDMPEQSEFKEALSSLYALGVLTDDDMDEAGNFRPDDNLVIPEMGQWLGRIGALQAAKEITPQALAEELYSLGLLYGEDNTGKNFALDRTANRVEGLAMLIRLLGKEEEARAGSWSYSFQDVPKWADPYVGYAYENGLAAGVSSTKYDSDSDTTVYMYLTFVLRALGYSDVEGDFSWKDPYDLAAEAGILPSDVDQEQFLRADLVLVSVAALGATLKGSEQTLADKLIEDGVFTQEQYDALTLIPRALTEWA